MSNISRRNLMSLSGGAVVSGLTAGCSKRETEIAPMMPDNVHFASISDVAAKIKAREISPLELTKTILGRIDRIDPALKSYALVTRERAFQEATKAEEEIQSGLYRGPLHGIPIAVKDLIYTKNIRTAGGLAVRDDFVPDFDAPVLKNLNAAGAVLLGKINLTEGAMAGYHRDFDIPVNPWNAEYWSGASSSGSGVAPVAGLCFAALGSDTGGSIRFPAMANGAVGLKPTYGLVSRHGVLALGESLDHIGPLARRAGDAAIMLEAMAGHDPNDPTSLDIPKPDLVSTLNDGVRGLRIGYDAEFAGNGTDPGLVTAMESALATLEELGAEIVEVSVPAAANNLVDPWFAICASEAVEAHAATYPSRADEYGGYFGDFLAIGAATTTEQIVAARAFRAQFVIEFEAMLSGIDALAVPSGGAPFKNDADLYGNAEALAPLFAKAQMQFTIPADFAGTPGLTVRCGFSDDDMPYSIQFLGSKLSEATLCRIGHAYEQATEWHKRHPEI